MHITKRENKGKEEVELILEEFITSDAICELEKEIENILTDSWQKLILNLKYIDTLNLEILKMLWKEKIQFNSKQKAFEIVGAKDFVAMSLKFSGFYKYFCTKNITFNSKKIKDIVKLGLYDEPILKYEKKSSIDLFENELVDEKCLTDSITKLNEKFDLDIIEWVILSEQNENKIIFLLELKNLYNINIDDISEFLENFFDNKIKCSIYILEEDTFECYKHLKKKNGIPEEFIKIPKIIFNPCDKIYFLGRIDERF